MEQLLTAREKRDTEALALQRALQDVEMQYMLLERKSFGYEEKQIGQDAKRELADVAHEIDKSILCRLR
ncbi:hypothetical protein CBS470a_013491 [Colletotrichum nupharicola]|nr:hypothetical protein CBS470a_013491 [Colletotrichum nupharicola]